VVGGIFTLAGVGRGAFVGDAKNRGVLRQAQRILIAVNDDPESRARLEWHLLNRICPGIGHLDHKSRYT
jgi:hypothetical protein